MREINEYPKDPWHHDLLLQQYLDSVAARPDEDYPREMYANAIAQYDRARAKFIRAQIQLSKGEKSGALLQREQELIHENQLRWSKDFEWYLDQLDASRRSEEHVPLDQRIPGIILDAVEAVGSLPTALTKIGLKHGTAQLLGLVKQAISKPLEVSRFERGFPVEVTIDCFRLKALARGILNVQPSLGKIVLVPTVDIGFFTGRTISETDYTLDQFILIYFLTGDKVGQQILQKTPYLDLSPLGEMDADLLLKLARYLDKIGRWPENAVDLSKIGLLSDRPVKEIEKVLNYIGITVAQS